ncbi:MAG: TonB-dependent receptor [Phycisphaerae bacterium]|nr:TonB-dependent receptor [Phycisphaerae bacterium]
MKKHLVLICVVAGLGFCGVLSAKQDTKTPEQSYELEDVVISASRSGTLLKNSPSSTTIITEDAIKNSPDDRIDEFLRRVPTITLAKSHRTECAPREVFLRGIYGGDKTVVLLNGIPMNGAGQGWVPWSLIPKESIEKIEIIRGPMSALYGSRAVGGVINLITKKPVKERETTLKLSYDSLDTWKTFVSQSGSSKEVDYYFSGRYYDTQGYKSAKDAQSYHRAPDRTDWTGNGEVTFYPDDTSWLKVGFAHSDEDIERPRKFTYEHFFMTMGYLTYSKKLENGWSFENSIYAKHKKWNVMFDSPSAALGTPYNYYYSKERSDIDDMGEMFKVIIPAGQRHTLTMGVDLGYARLRKKDTVLVPAVSIANASGKQTSLSFFLQDEMSLSDDLIVTLGGRMDQIRSYDGSYDGTHYDSKTVKAFSPKVGIVYHLNNKTTLKGSFGKSFAAPNLTQLYTVLKRGVVTVNGNPNLSPEKSTSYEFGLEHTFSEKLSGNFYVHHTTCKDFINYRTTATGPGPFITQQYDNTSEVTIDGIDTYFNYKINNLWTFTAGYAYSEARVKKDNANSALEGNKPAFSPEHKANFGLTFDDPNLFRVDMDLRYTGNRYTSVDNDDRLGRSWVLDLMISKQIDENTNVALGVENVFDVKYDILGIPRERSVSPGRIISVHLTRTF